MSQVIVKALQAQRERLMLEVAEIDDEVARLGQVVVPKNLHWTQTPEGRKRLRAREAAKKKAKVMESLQAETAEQEQTA